jgi:Glycosyltransferase family 87
VKPEQLPVVAASLTALTALTARRGRAVWIGLSIAGAIVAVWFVWTFGLQGMGYDLAAYRDVRLDDLYGRSSGSLETFGAFRYSPSVAFLLSPLRFVPLPILVPLWTALLVGVLVWIAGRWSLALLAFPGIDISIYLGNIDILIAASIVLALRFPAAWSFGILTKVTPGIGLIWHVVRKEWRALGIAAAATLALSVPVILARPDLWGSWISTLQNNSELRTGNEIPLGLRVAVGAALIAWGARANQPWVLGIAIAIAEPTLTLRGLSIAAASIGILRRRPTGPTALDRPVLREPARSAQSLQ